MWVNDFDTLQWLSNGNMRGPEVGGQEVVWQGGASGQVLAGQTRSQAGPGDALRRNLEPFKLSIKQECWP